MAFGTPDKVINGTSYYNFTHKDGRTAQAAESEVQNFLNQGYTLNNGYTSYAGGGITTGATTGAAVGAGAVKPATGAIGGGVVGTGTAPVKPTPTTPAAPPAPATPTQSTESLVLGRPVKAAPAGSVAIRDYLSQKGYAVGYDPATKSVTVNGTPLTTDFLPNVNGVLYANQAWLDNWVNDTFNKPGGVVQNPYGSGIIQTPSADTGFTPPSQLNQNVSATQEDTTQSTAPVLGDIVNEVIRQTGIDPTQGFNPSRRQQINDLISGIPKFDPSQLPNDPRYKAALKNVETNITNMMARRGIAGGTIPIEEYAKQAGELEAKMYGILYDEYIQNANMIFQQAEFLNDLDQQDYQIYKDNINNFYKMVELSYQELTRKYQEEDRQIKKQRDRVEDLGYVDNEASAILGLPVGTLSSTARQRSEELEDYIKKQEIDLEYDIKAKKSEALLKTSELTASQQLKEQQGQAKAAVVQRMASMSPTQMLAYLTALDPQIIEAMGGDAYERLWTYVQSLIGREIDDQRAAESRAQANEEKRKKAEETANDKKFPLTPSQIVTQAQKMFAEVDENTKAKKWKASEIIDWLSSVTADEDDLPALINSVPGLSDAYEKEIRRNADPQWNTDWKNQKWSVGG